MHATTKFRPKCFNVDDHCTLANFDMAGTARLMYAERPSAGAIRRAIAAAEKAFASFRRTTHAARAAMLEKWYGLIMANQEDLARIMTQEQGKPLAEARGEIVYTASFVKWYAEEARRIGGTTVPAPQAKHAYMINVASYQNGVGYGDGWLHIDGFSEAVLRYIVALEAEAA